MKELHHHLTVKQSVTGQCKKWHIFSNSSVLIDIMHMEFAKEVQLMLPVTTQRHILHQSFIKENGHMELYLYLIFIGCVKNVIIYNSKS